MLNKSLTHVCLFFKLNSTLKNKILMFSFVRSYFLTLPFISPNLISYFTLPLVRQYQRAVLASATSAQIASRASPSKQQLPQTGLPPQQNAKSPTQNAKSPSQSQSQSQILQSPSKLVAAIAPESSEGLLNSSDRKTVVEILGR